jgi:hypothetical protein
MEQQSSPRAGQACLRGESPTTAALDYVDCYLIHTPFAFRPGDEQDPRDERGQVIYDSGVTLVETWRALERLVDDGQCKSIGLSDITLEKLQEIVAAARIKPAVVEVESHPYHPQWELLDFCRQHGIVLLAFAALGHGMRPKLLENPVITTIAQRVAEMYASLRTTARVPSKGMPQAPCARAQGIPRLFILATSTLRRSRTRIRTCHSSAPTAGLPCSTQAPSGRVSSCCRSCAFSSYRTGDSGAEWL